MNARLAKWLHWVVPLLLGSILIILAGNAGSKRAVPGAMAALGDSITQANNATTSGDDQPAYSWSTGDRPATNSLYLRFLLRNPMLLGKNRNYSVSGATMAGLSAQVRRVALDTEYVTILMGANDACASSEAAMTSTTTFQAQTRSAFDQLKSRLPQAQVLVMSIPNVYHLWDVLKDDPGARAHWTNHGVCPSMLANPSSMAQADVDRRARVKAHVEALNAVLRTECARYGANCTFDNNAVYHTRFTAGDVSTRDYFHPSDRGQAKLAEAAWLASGFAP